MNSEKQSWKDQYSIPIDTAGGAEKLVPAPDLASLIGNEDFFRVKKSRKNIGKESVVLTDSSRADLSGHFELILDHFDGDLARVKSYVNDFGQNQKLLLEQRLITNDEYKKSLLITSSMRGKATYRAYQNYIYTKSNEKISKKSTGLRGLFYGKKSAKADTEELKGIAHSPIAVMKEWSKSKKETGGGFADEVWVSSRKYEKTRNQLEKYWKNKGEVLDQESIRLLKEANIDSRSLVKAKRRISTTPPSWKQKVVLGALSVGILWGGIHTSQARASAYQNQAEVAALAEQFNNEWDERESSLANSIEITSKEPNITVQTSSDTAVEQIVSPEIEATELLLKPYNEIILPNRYKFLASIPETERNKIIESIGGPENIDNGKFSFVVFGKDAFQSTMTGKGEVAAPNGVDKDGKPLGRNDQNIIVIVNIKQNSIDLFSIPRDIAIPPGMYGRSTPYTLNGLTWINQDHSSEEGGYVSLDRAIAQKVFTDISGVYIDGTVEFDFTSSVRMVDAILPHGITLEMTETFWPSPGNQVVAGYEDDGTPKQFIEGQKYTFNGTTLFPLLRDRSHRSGDGTYNRERDAVQALSSISKEMVSQFLEAGLFEKLTSSYDAYTTIQQLEKNGNFRSFFWGEELPPDEVFTTIIEAIDPMVLQSVTSSYKNNPKDVIPEFETHSIAAEQMIAAPQYPHKIIPKTGLNNKDPQGYQRNPQKFWKLFRDLVESALEIK